MKHLGGPDRVGIGFAAGIERLVLALPETLALPREAARRVRRRARASRRAPRRSALLRDLRRAGLNAQVEYEGRSLKSQMKRADRLKAPLVFILGEDELARGEVTVRRMAAVVAGVRRPLGRRPSELRARRGTRPAMPDSATWLLIGTEAAMLDQLGDWTRTHTCGALRAADIGREVTLLGWVHRVRDLGALVFIDVRDRYGLTQVVVQEGQAFLDTAKHLRAEFVVGVKGVGAGSRRPTR